MCGQPSQAHLALAQQGENELVFARRRIYDDRLARVGVAEQVGDQLRCRIFDWLKIHDCARQALGAADGGLLRPGQAEPGP